MSNTPKFVPDPNQSSKRVYANFASIRATGLDFTISFLDVLPPTKEHIKLAKEGKEIPMPLQCEIVVPNQLIPSLIGALKEQYEKFQHNLKKEGKSSVENSNPSGKV